eukprot:GGOE01003883.1.p1 GENE.GGOE01003883.1~~GGOE01003883.1.p1  ORF type:complete len:1674 (+),score=399.36 GGOE01003883.1:508-5022(+)
MADELFRRMLKDGVPVDTPGCNALLGAYAAAGRWEQGLQLLHWMADADVQPDIVSYNTVLAALCAAEQLERAFELFSSMSQAGRQPDTRTGSTLISACARAGDVSSAFQVFDWMAQNDVHINTVVCNAILSACGAKSDWQSAFQVFDWMLEAGVPPDTVTCASLIRSCRGTEQWKRAEQVWQWVLQMGLPTSDVLVAQLLRVYVAAAQLERAELLAGSLESLGLTHTSWTYAALAEARIKAGDAEGLWSTLTAMVEAGVPPNTEVAMSLLSAALHEKAPRLVHDLWQWLESHRVPRDTACYNVVLTSCRSVSQLRPLLQQMAQRGLRRDALTYKALLLLLAREGQWEEVQQALQQCATDKVLPTEETFAIVLKNATAQRLPEVVRTVAAAFRTTRLPQTPAIYAALIKAHAACGDRAGALHAYRELRASGLAVELRAYTRIAQVMVADYSLVREVFQAVEDAGLGLDSFAAAVLLKACAEAGQWQHAEIVVAALPEEDVTPEMHHSCSLAYAVGGRWGEALAIVDRQFPAGERLRFVERLLPYCKSEAGGEELWGWMAHLPSVPLRILRLAMVHFLRNQWWVPAGKAGIVLVQGHPAEAVSLIVAELSAHCRCAEEWEGAWQLLQHLQQAGALDVASISPPLLHHAARVLPLATVEAWMTWQEGLGVEVDTQVHAVLRDRLAAASRPSVVEPALPEGVWRWVQRLDTQHAGLHSYTAIIDQALRLKDYVTPWEVLKHMRRVNVVPDSRCFHPVLFACLQAKQWDRVRSVVQSMMEAGVSLQFWVAPRITRSGGWRCALLLLRLHRQFNLQPPANTRMWVATACLAAGKPKPCLAVMHGAAPQGLRRWRLLVQWACREADGPSVLTAIHRFLAQPLPPKGGLDADDLANRHQLAMAARLEAMTQKLHELAAALKQLHSHWPISAAAVSEAPASPPTRQEAEEAAPYEQWIQDGRWDVALKTLTASPSAAACDLLLRHALRSHQWSAFRSVVDILAQHRWPGDPELWLKAFVRLTVAEQWPEAFLMYEQVQRTGLIPPVSVCLSFLGQCVAQGPDWLAAHWLEVGWLVQRLQDTGVALPAEVQAAMTRHTDATPSDSPPTAAAPASTEALPHPSPLTGAASSSWTSMTDATLVVKASTLRPGMGFTMHPPASWGMLGLGTLGSVLVSAPQRSESSALEAAWAELCQQVDQQSSDRHVSWQTAKPLVGDQLIQQYGHLVPADAFARLTHTFPSPSLMMHHPPRVDVLATEANTLPSTPVAPEAPPKQASVKDNTDWVYAVRHACSQGVWPHDLLTQRPAALSIQRVNTLWLPLQQLCLLAVSHSERLRRLQDLERCGMPSRNVRKMKARLQKLKGDPPTREVPSIRSALWLAQSHRLDDEQRETLRQQLQEVERRDLLPAVFAARDGRGGDTQRSRRAGREKGTPVASGGTTPQKKGVTQAHPATPSCQPPSRATPTTPSAEEEVVGLSLRRSLALTMWGKQEASAQLVQLSRDLGRVDLLEALQTH